MNKTELIATMADELDMSKRQSRSVLNTIIETMTNSLVRSDSISLRGFGNFVIKQYGSHEGRNPMTGVKVQVKPKKLPHFKASKSLLLKVNGG